MSNVTLKITLTALGTTKMMQFMSETTVHDACKEIRTKFGEAAGGADHALYWPENFRWLIPARILEFYDLKSGDALEFKKKHRPIRIRMLDGAIKTVIIDETLVVQELVAIACEHIGIMNAEEYSFSPENTENFRGRGHVEKGKNKDKLLAGDESVWLVPDKTLSEQGMTESDAVVLRKKFFFTDQNIDRNDPVQLNLMYNQAREMIVNGNHPCTADEAAQFGAIQMQIQFGNHEPDKHKPGFVKMKDYVPPEYQRSRDVEKRMYIQHAKLQGLSELNGKFRYAQLSRSLKTYGITFYLVKERHEKKNKLVNVLLGVTKQSVVRLDAETKEITKEWRLTQLRRWAASPNSFTLDFGDYADSYYSVQTTEGENISQLIAGYIDIIVKKKKDADKYIEAEVEEQAVVEDYVKPVKATTISMATSVQQKAQVGNRPGVARNMDMSRASFDPNIQTARFGTGTAYGRMAEISGAHQITLQHLSNGFAIVNSAAVELSVAAQLPPLGNDAASLAWVNQAQDSNSDALVAQLAAHLSATAALVNGLKGSAEDLDYEVLGSSVSGISSNLRQISEAVRMLAALQSNETQREELLSAARAVAVTTGNLLESAGPAITGHAGKEDLYASAKALAQVVNTLLSLCGRLESTEDFQQTFLKLVTSIGASLSDVVSGARTAAQAVKDADAAQLLAVRAKNGQMEADLIQTVAQVVSPVLTSNLAFAQLNAAAKSVQDGIRDLLAAAGASQDSRTVEGIKENSKRALDGVAKLLSFAKAGPNGEMEEDTAMDDQFNMICESIQLLQGKVDGATFVDFAKELTLNSTQFINSLKAASDSATDQVEQERLMNAARSLAEATSRMVASARNAARDLSSADNVEALQEALQGLKNAANTAAGPRLRAKVFTKLQKAVSETVSSANQLITASKTASSSNRNQASQLQLNQAAKKVGEVLPPISQATKACHRDPSDSMAQLKLINVAKTLMVPGQGLVASAKMAVPTTNDQAVQMQLTNAANVLTENLQKLEQTCKLSEDLSQSLIVDQTHASIRMVERDLVAAKERGGYADPKKAEELAALHASDLHHEITSSLKVLHNTLPVLVAAVNNTNQKQAVNATTEATSALRTIGSASVTAVAWAAADNNEAPDLSVLHAITQIAQGMHAIVDAAAPVMENGRPGDLLKLEDSQDAIIKAIIHTYDLLPGQKELSELIAKLDRKKAMVFEMGTVRGENYAAAQGKVQVGVAAAAVAANNVVNATKASLLDVRDTVIAFDGAIEKLTASITAFCKASPDASLPATLSQSYSDILRVAMQLLQNTKAAAADNTNSQLRSALFQSSQVLVATMDKLAEACSGSAPGQSECNAALSKIAQAHAWMESVNETAASPELTYSQCVTKLTAASRACATHTAAINNAVRAEDPIALAKEAVDISNQMLAMTEAVGAAAYLIGIADSSSIAAQAPIVDQASILATCQEVEQSCVDLLAPDNTQTQILTLAGNLAKQTASLCNACKLAANNLDVAVANRQHFSDLAREIANRINALVPSIKALAGNLNETTLDNTEQAAVPLLDIVDKLAQFASSSAFAGTDAKMSANAALAQKPLLDANRTLLQAAQETVQSIKMVCASPKEDDMQKLLQATVRSLSEALQHTNIVVTKSAPGQQECADAIAKLQECTGTVSAAVLESSVNNLEPQDHVDKMHVVDSLRVLASLIDVVVKAAKENAGQLAVAVGELPVNFSKVAQQTTAVASNLPDMDAQLAMLQDLEKMGQSVVNMLTLAKTMGGSQANEGAVKNVMGERAQLKESIGKMITLLEGSRDDSGDFAKGVEHMENLMNLGEEASAQLAEQGKSDPYSTHAIAVEVQGKAALEAVTEVISKTKTPAQFRAMTGKLNGLVEHLFQTSEKGSGATEDIAVSTSLKEAARNMCANQIKLVEAMRLASGRSAADALSRGKLNQAARDVSSAIVHLIAAAKEGNKGLLVCENILERVRDIGSEIESSFIFATAGQLDPLDARDNFTRHKDNLLAATKAVTETTKSFITAITGSQDALAGAAANSLRALEALRTEARHGAISITSADKNMQIQLLQATQSVTETMAKLIAGAIKANGRPADDPVMNELSDAVRNNFTAIGELVSVTRILGDESSRGIRAAEGAKAGIDEALASMTSDAPAQGTALPDEVTGLAKQLASSAANLLVAAHKQDDFIAACNAIKKQLFDLARAGKASTDQAPAESKAAMSNAVMGVGQAIKDLLDKVRAGQQTNTPAVKAQIQTAAKGLTVAVNEVVNAASSLVPTGYIDSSDPNVIAERELLAAAVSIEAAARKLASLVPEEKVQADESLNFEGQILAAAKGIANATAALVRSATGTQREIVAKGRTGPKETQMYFSDGTWSDGLVSAAKMVAAATSDLCDAANQAIKGNVQRERVIVAAKSVNASTMQLLTAAMVRSDPSSASQIRLNAAGKAVQSATDQLVKAAEENMAFEDAGIVTTVAKPKGLANTRVAEMEAAMSVLKMERELEKARTKLSALRKGKYESAGSAATT
ncbi:hypothetical protein CXG81DRAFT_4250, partial [Caulochytrium protostelioides]